MPKANLKNYRLGWVGTGRMGYAMAARLAEERACGRCRLPIAPGPRRNLDRIWRPPLPIRRPTWPIAISFSPW